MRFHDLGAVGRVRQPSATGVLAAGILLAALGHLAVGYAIAVHAARSPRPPAGSIRILWLLIVAAALLPDLDILAAEFGVAEHRGASHSLGMAAAFGGAVGLFARWRRQAALVWGVAAFVSMASHGILDMFSAGPGVKFLWPVTDAVFASAVRPLPTPQVFEVFTPQGLLIVGIEIILFSPLVVASWIAARRRSGGRDH